RLQLLDPPPHRLGDVQRVGARKLEDVEADGGVEVVRGVLTVVGCAELDVGDVAETNDARGWPLSAVEGQVFRGQHIAGARSRAGSAAAAGGDVVGRQAVRRAAGGLAREADSGRAAGAVGAAAAGSAAARVRSAAAGDAAARRAGGRTAAGRRAA